MLIFLWFVSYFLFSLFQINGQNVVGLKDKEISAIIREGPSPITVTIMPNFVYEHMLKKYV